MARLNRQSVEKHYDAYADIAWDAPENEVDAADPRWALPEIDSLGATAWYRSLPPAEQARLGLWRAAAAMKIGQQFENILKRGLLEYAYKLPNGATEYRYAYHEVIEEAHHGLMFQEFVNRTGLPIKGLPGPLRAAANAVVLLGRLFPELFFFFVLGGEDPIDHVQRNMLRDAKQRERHPLLVTIMRHHVTEEARHLSFARHYLKLHVPKLGFVRRQVLALAIPAILGVMALLMLAPPRSMVREFQIPDHVLDEAYRKNEHARGEPRQALRKVRYLAVELGLVNRASKALWKAFGIWDG